MSEEKESRFCLNDYDVIGFDMDHTLVQYKLTETFQLLFNCVTDYLVNEKNHNKDFFHVDNFEKYEDFSTRGIVYDIKLGNFVKLDKEGNILKCTHGLIELSEEKIKEYYGASKVWPKFEILKKTVYHGDGYWIMENFFLVPITPILGLMVKEADDKCGGYLDDYTYLYNEIIDALNLAFSAPCFKADTGGFFPALKKFPERYVKKCPKTILNWLKELRAKGKIVCLITDSFPDFATHLMDYTVGPDWKEFFDVIITHANKPNFFQEFHKKRLFVTVNDDIEESDKLPATEHLQKHTLYTLGSAWRLMETCKYWTGKKELKGLYFGDSMKSDIFPPKKAGWDTVAVLEELEAEEVHFHKKDSIHESPLKKAKQTTLLKEEKLIVASTFWGSFFAHPTSKDKENGPNKKRIPNTFWGDVIKVNSKLCIPILDYLAECSLGEKIPCFTNDQFGFFPSVPRSLCTLEICDEN